VITPIQVTTPLGGFVNPPSSHRGIRIATVPGTKIVNSSVFRIGQNLRGIAFSVLGSGKTAGTTLL
jgi:hypothetical protein